MYLNKYTFIRINKKILFYFYIINIFNGATIVIGGNNKEVDLAEEVLAEMNTMKKNKVLYQQLNKATN